MSRQIILPGEKIADKKVHMQNSFAENDSTYAAVIGLLDEEGRYIPLETRYRPSVEDTVIGIVTDARHIGYELNINMSSTTLLSTRDFRINLDIGDIVVAKVYRVDEMGAIELTEVRKLTPGKVIVFPPAKVPRLIGRKSSMINMIRENTGGDIIVGNNGYVWMSAESNISLVLKTINTIIKKAHTSGLTDEIAEFLKRETKK